jgi:17beta-estradiol 17-dehydrogenase / very-long-chain 3-oxoacyl-CoA reductase
MFYEILYYIYCLLHFVIITVGYTLGYYLCWVAIWVFGLLTFGQFAIGIAHLINKYFIRKSLNLPERYGKGTWVVVTGATGGIGSEFCRQLANIGFNIVLVSRSQDKLEESERELLKDYPAIQTKIVVADFAADTSPEFYQAIYEQIKDLEISMLVNNAGMAIYDFFKDVKPEFWKDMVNINCTSYAMLTRALINKLLEREQRSAIINVASISSLSPICYQGAYPATKRFVRFFTYGLHDNYKEKIDILGVNPGLVETKMIKGTQATSSEGGVSTPEQTVRNTLRDLGYDIETAGYLPHEIQGHAIEILYRYFTPIWRAGISMIIEVLALRVKVEKIRESQKH